MIKNLTKFIFLQLIFISTASATTFSIFEDLPIVGQGATGTGSVIYEYESTFNNSTNFFTHDFVMRPNDASGEFINFYTLAVNDGPNPKAGDLALLYVDLEQDVVTAYSYANGRNSYLDGEFVTSISNAVTNSIDADGNLNVSLAFDATEINNFNSTNPDYDGIRFDNLFGQWFHTSFGAQIAYEATGEIASLELGARGPHIDSGNRVATEIPEPMTMSLLGIGLIGGAIRRRKA